MAEQEGEDKPKRRTPATMRDKAAADSAKSGKTSRMKKVLRFIFRPLRPAGKLLQRIERFKPVHIIGLVLVPRYFRNSWRELRQVSWPNGKETRQLTTAVMLFATVFGILIALTDYGLDKIFKKVILKQ